MHKINNIQPKESQCKNDPFQSLLSFFTTENQKKLYQEQLYVIKANILHAI